VIIIGVDGADYNIAKNYFDVELLEVDLDPKNTATIWTSYFSGMMPSEHKVFGWKSVIGSPAEVDFIWNHGDWTVFAAPVCMPPLCINCSTSDYHLKTDENSWINCYESHNTDHFAGVIRAIDTASHSRPREEALKWYEKVFEIVGEIKWDVLISDHGFKNFNLRKGNEDHSEHGIIKGIDVNKASEFVKKIKTMMKTME